MLDHRKKEMLKTVLRDPDRKSIFKIIYEFSKCSILNKELAGHYFTRLLYKKDIDNHMDYLTNKEIQAIRYGYMNSVNQELAEVLNNKILFHKYFSLYNISTPNTLGWNDYTKVTVGDNIYDAKNEEDLKKLLVSIMIMNNLNSLILKPTDGCCGQGCKIININGINEEYGLYKNILENSYIFQEVITQHPDVNVIYPYSLNTIRMDTYIDDQDNINIISAYIRFGANKSVVDNASSGGCFVSIDMNDGKLRDKGYQLLEHGGKVYYEHPNTKTPFKGFIVPYFDETKKLVLNAARLLPYKITGWDIGITKDGPVLIEGNSIYHIYVSEMAYGGYRKHPIYQEILRKYT